MSAISGARIVIVGGGVAGCVLAARLSEDPAVDVLVIEEGGWLAGTHPTAALREPGSVHPPYPADGTGPGSTEPGRTGPGSMGSGSTGPGSTGPGHVPPGGGRPGGASGIQSLGIQSLGIQSLGAAFDPRTARVWHQQVHSQPTSERPSSDRQPTSDQRPSSDRQPVSERPSDPSRQRGEAATPPDQPARSIELRAGRVVGGSGRMNGAYFIRPTNDDIQRLDASVTDASFGTELREAMVRCETDRDYGQQPHHGSAGPVIVERDVNPAHPATTAFLEAAAALGVAPHADLNDGEPAGIGPVPLATDDGSRVDPSVSYLAAALGRPNLSVMTDTRVLQVLVDGTTATGVSVRSRTAGAPGAACPVTIRADVVVLCAGTLGTPALLLASGIGPSDHLAPLGLPIVADLPRVGAAILNHPCIDLTYLPTTALSNRTGPAVGNEPVSFMQYAMHTATAVGHPVDAEFMATRLPYGRVTGLDPHDALLSLRITAVASRMPVALQAVARPHRSDAPDVGFTLVTPQTAPDAEDRARLREAVRLGSDLFGSITGSLGARTRNAPARSTLASDAALDAWIMENTTMAFHMIGSCPMSDDPGSGVVDRRFAVHGIDGLYIVDASVVSVQLSRGPFAAVVALAELAAVRLRSNPG